MDARYRMPDARYQISFIRHLASRIRPVIKKISFTYLFIFTALTTAFTNSAPPSFYLGGNPDISVFFPKDTVQYKHVQMKSEEIVINLYKGFAAVKGTYYMVNHSDSMLSFHTGYPVNGNYNSHIGRELYFDDLHNINVLINGRKTPVSKCEMVDDGKYRDRMNNPDNWYVWETVFAPHDTTVITVFFLVKTESRLKVGYNSDQDNAFAYVLESGRPWKDKTENGKVLMMLKDGISTEDIIGLSNDRFLTNNKDILYYIFENLEPDENSNLIVRYEKSTPSIDFEKVKKESARFYNELNMIDLQSLDVSSYTAIKVSDFDAGMGFNSFLITVLFILSAFGMPLLLLAVAIISAIIIIRKLKKKKSSGV